MKKSRWILSMMSVVGCLLLSPDTQATEVVRIFAASSMSNALEQVIAQYQQQHKEATIVASFASSATLARQIIQGAPADIFISADQQWMNYLTEKQSVVAESQIVLLSNRLVLIAPQHSPLTTFELTAQTDWQQLLAGGRLAVGDPDSVPAGRYAKQALESLHGWQMLSSQLAPAKNVRAALMLVEREEAPLGVVYSTDAKANSKVKVVAMFPADSHQPITYPMVRIHAQDSAAVKDFYLYLQSQEAMMLFRQYGFMTYAH